MNASNYPDADDKFGNAPYFNFNDDKLNFDFNKVDNANPNYGSASGFRFGEFLKVKSSLLQAVLFYFRDLIHPPSILPTSCNFSSKKRYFFVGVALISLDNLINILSKSNLTVAFSR